VLLHLVFIGLVAAGTILLFSVAAVSFLDIGKEPLATSRIGARAVPSTDAKAASALPEISSTQLDSAKIPEAFEPRGAPSSETSGPSGIEPAQRPLPDRDATTTRSETADAALIPDVYAIATRSTEASGSEHLTAGALPTADANKFVRPSPASNDKTAAQNPRVQGHLLRPNSAFRRRVQTEVVPDCETAGAAS
jgi:hypothetical protein